MIWTPKVFEEAIQALRASNSVTRVCQNLSTLWGETISTKALDCAFRRGQLQRPALYLANPAEIPDLVPVTRWNPKTLQQASQVLRRHGTVVQACIEISDLLGWTVTPMSLQKAFKVAGRKPPGTYVDKVLKHEAVRAQAAKAAQSSHRATFEAAAKKPVFFGRSSDHPGPRGFERVMPVEGDEEQQDEKAQHLEVVRLVQKGKGSIEAIADALDCAPKEARRRIDAAASAGYNVKWHGETVAFVPDRPADPSEALHVPWDGRERCFGVIADSHAGSITHEKEGQIAFINMAHQCGAEEIWHAGDVVEGTYYFRQGQLEQYAVGYEAQSKDALEGLPRLKGLKYRIVAGNHDFTYQREVGLDPVKNMALVHGRDDITPMGYPIGRLVYGDDPDNMFKVELAHPKTRPAYAASWPIQKFVERMQGGSKPHILVMGHLHSHLTGDFRSIWCVMPGCWQWATTYESSQGLEPAVGGVLVWVRREGREFKIRHEWHAMRAKPVSWHK